MNDEGLWINFALLIRLYHLSKYNSFPVISLNQLSSPSFYLNLQANEIVDVAASSLLVLPDDTILNMDTFVSGGLGD